MTAPDPDKQLGMYRKFELYRLKQDENGIEHGNLVTDPFFILRYTTDPYARVALLAYADVCEAEYPQLASDLRAAVARAEGRE